MKKQYSLDFSIVRDTDRVAAVQNILDSLDHDPGATDLEQMANYILYGKDEEGRNAIQRNEAYEQSKRYNSYKTSDDKVLSLDELLENPLMDQQQLRPAHQRDCYTKPKPTITRPKYNKKTGELIDIGDGDIPGMKELWDSIDKLERWIRQLKGEIPADEDTLMFDDSYRLYRLKHTLIDMRRHQYYLKDAYKPVLHFAAIDHPKAQFYDWAGDSFYWVPYKVWEDKVNHAYTSRVSKDIKDYEVRGEGDQLEVKWIVCEHNFDWENPKHVRALINHYDSLREYLNEKLDTYGRTLIWDFERYRDLCNFSPIRNFLLDCKIDKMPYAEMLEQLQIKFGIVYNKNHLSNILISEIPEKIALMAKRGRLLIETPPENKKICKMCNRLLPMDTMFFSRNNSRKDGFSIHCKECERQLRINRGNQNEYDLRSKDQTVSKM